MEKQMQEFKDQIKECEDMLTKKRKAYAAAKKAGDSNRATLIALSAEGIKADLKYLQARLGAMEYATGVRPVNGHHVQQRMPLNAPTTQIESPKQQVEAKGGE